jgi:hypothetical protein
VTTRNGALSGAGLQRSASLRRVLALYSRTCWAPCRLALCDAGGFLSNPSRATAPPQPCARRDYRSPAPRCPSPAAGRTMQGRPPLPPHVEQDLPGPFVAAGRNDQRPDATDHRDLTHAPYSPPPAWSAMGITFARGPGLPRPTDIRQRRHPRHIHRRATRTAAATVSPVRMEAAVRAAHTPALFE